MTADEDKPSVLCIEDDDATSILIGRALRRAGYDVVMVCSGAEGVARFGTQTWAALVVDQQLPDFGGLEVLERIRSLGALPATVMVTGRGSERLVVSALKQGAHDYIVKDGAESYLELLPEVVGKAVQLVREREVAARVAAENERLVEELQQALAKIKTLSGLIPICASCKSIRNDGGFWESLEVYLTAHSDALLSHGLCPTCLPKYFPSRPTR